MPGYEGISAGVRRDSSPGYEGISAGVRRDSSPRYEGISAGVRRDSVLHSCADLESFLAMYPVSFRG